ncbi:MAG: hypothetical protein JSS56_22650, partial [Proteobacteria bacterium]|nr:hypothetical protein [Pseudomonadota bacterium]
MEMGRRTVARAALGIAALGTMPISFPSTRAQRVCVLSTTETSAAQPLIAA